MTYLMQIIFFYVTLTVILIILGLIYNWLDINIPRAVSSNVDNNPIGVLIVLLIILFVGFIGWTIPETVNAYLVTHPDFDVRTVKHPSIKEVPYFARVYKVLFALAAVSILIRGAVLWRDLYFLGAIIIGIVWLFQ